MLPGIEQDLSTDNFILTCINFRINTLKKARLSAELSSIQNTPETEGNYNSLRLLIRTKSTQIREVDGILVALSKSKVEMQAKITQLFDNLYISYIESSIDSLAEVNLKNAPLLINDLKSRANNDYDIRLYQTAINIYSSVSISVFASDSIIDNNVDFLELDVRNGDVIIVYYQVDNKGPIYTKITNLNQVRQHQVYFTTPLFINFTTGYDIKRLGNIPSNKLNVSGNSLKAEGYIAQYKKDWSTKVINKTALILPTLPPGESKDKKAIQAIEREQGYENKRNAEKALATVNEILNRKDEVANTIDEGSSRSTNDLKAQMEVVNQPGYEISNPPKLIGSYEPTIRDTERTSVEITPVINNQGARTANVVDNFYESRGVQLVEGDLIDPTDVQIVIPQSAVNGIRSYIKIFPINGEAFNTADAISEVDGQAKLNIKNSGKLPSIDDLMKPVTLDNTFNQLVYNQFSLTRFTKGYDQKVQIIETISDGLAVFAFGDKAKIWSVSGQLLNDVLNQWQTKFEYVWDKHLNISRLTFNNCYAQIVVPSDFKKVNCYPLNLQIDHNTQNEVNVSFTMNILVRNFSKLTKIGLSPALRSIITQIAALDK